MKVRTVMYEKDRNGNLQITDIWEKEITFRKDGCLSKEDSGLLKRTLTAVGCDDPRDKCTECGGSVPHRSMSMFMIK